VVFALWAIGLPENLARCLRMVWCTRHPTGKRPWHAMEDWIDTHWLVWV
jgi:hypothetical protein